MIPVDVSVDGSARARWPMRDGRRRATAARVLRTRTHAAAGPAPPLVEAAADTRPRPPSRRRRREGGVCGAGGRMGEMSREMREQLSKA